MTDQPNPSSGERGPPTRPFGCTGPCRRDLGERLLQLFDEITESLVVKFDDFAHANGLNLQTDFYENLNGRGNNTGGQTQDRGGRPSTPTHHNPRWLSHVLNPAGLSPDARRGAGQASPFRRDPARAPVFRAPTQNRDAAPSPPGPQPAAPAASSDNAHAHAGAAAEEEGSQEHIHPHQIKREHDPLEDRIPREGESDGELEVEPWFDPYEHTPQTLRTNGNGSPISRTLTSRTNRSYPLLSRSPQEPEFLPRDYNAPPHSASGQAPPPHDMNGNQPSDSPGYQLGPNSPRYVPVSPEGYFGQNSPQYLINGSSISPIQPERPTSNSVPSQAVLASPPPQSASQLRSRTDVHSFRGVSPNTSPFYPDGSQQPASSPGRWLHGNTNTHPRALAAGPSSSGVAPLESQFEHTSTPTGPNEQGEASAYPSPQEALLPRSAVRTASANKKRQRSVDSDYSDAVARGWPNPTPGVQVGIFKFGPPRHRKNAKEETLPRKKQRADVEPVAQPPPTRGRGTGRLRQPTPGPSRLAPVREPVRKSSRLNKQQRDVKGKGKAKADF